MRELKDKIVEALVSALPITAIVYLLALTPLIDLTAVELITFTVSAVLLILCIILINIVSYLADDIKRSTTCQGGAFHYMGRSSTVSSRVRPSRCTISTALFSIAVFRICFGAWASMPRMTGQFSSATTSKKVSLG